MIVIFYKYTFINQLNEMLEVREQKSENRSQRYLVLNF